MSKLIVLSGVAGVGKSTWAAKYATEHPNTIIVSTDALRYELFGMYVLPRDKEKIVQKTLAQRVIEASKLNVTVIIDSACVKNKSILRLVNRFGQYFDNKELVVIDGSLEKCLRQNNQRDRHVPEEVIKEMFGYRQNIFNDSQIMSVFNNVTVVDNQGDR